MPRQRYRPPAERLNITEGSHARYSGSFNLRPVDIVGFGLQLDWSRPGSAGPDPAPAVSLVLTPGCVPSGGKISVDLGRYDDSDWWPDRGFFLLPTHARDLYCTMLEKLGLADPRRDLTWWDDEAGRIRRPQLLEADYEFIDALHGVEAHVAPKPDGFVERQRVSPAARAWAAPHGLRPTRKPFSLECLSEGRRIPGEFFLNTRLVNHPDWLLLDGKPAAIVTHTHEPLMALLRQEYSYELAWFDPGVDASWYYPRHATALVLGRRDVLADRFELIDTPQKMTAVYLRQH